MYWVYNLPNWLFGILTVGFFVAFSLAGMLPSREWARRVHVQRSHNDIVGFYLAGVTVLYGVTLGLLAIGAWTTFNETQTKVAREAAELSSLYRSVENLPEPTRTLLQNDLRAYVREVIDIGWPQQRRGIPPVQNNALLDKFERDFQSLNATAETQKIFDADVLREFDAVSEARSIRLDSVTDELPTPLWSLVLWGSFICIAVTWLFHMQSLRMHIFMTVLFSGLLGLLVFMVAALDNPYRGKISVGPESLQRVYSQMIRPSK